MSALMIAQPAATVTPPSSLGLAAGVTAAVWYPMHEGSGSSLAEKLGLGPDLVLAGAGGSEWGAWGRIAPNGSSQRAAASPEVSAYHQSVFRLDTISGQELLLGFDIATDGAMTTNECVLNWGTHNVGAGDKGGWSVHLNSGRQLNLVVWPEAAAAATTSTFSGSALPATTARVRVVIALRGDSATALSGTALRYIVGDGLQDDAPLVSAVAIGDGSTTFAPGADPSYGLLLFARRIGASGYDRYLGASAGSNATIQNLWAARLAAYTPGAAQAAMEDMIASPCEFPRSLRG